MQGVPQIGASQLSAVAGAAQLHGLIPLDGSVTMNAAPHPAQQPLPSTGKQNHQHEACLHDTASLPGLSQQILMLCLLPSLSVKPDHR